MQNLIKITLLLIAFSTSVFAAQPYKVKKRNLKLKQSPKVMMKDIKQPISFQVVVEKEIKQPNNSIKPLIQQVEKEQKTPTPVNLTLTSASYIPSAKNLFKISKLNKKSENYKLTKAEPKTHWAALTGMICGILGALGLPLFAICGVVFSSIGLSKIKKNPDSYKGRGMAIAGLVTGIVGVLFILAL